MFDRLTLEVLVRVAGIGEVVPEEPRVERPTRVDVGFTEVGVALRIPLLRPGRRACQRRRYRRSGLLLEI
jgi:hypothetical protein